MTKYPPLPRDFLHWSVFQHARVRRQNNITPRGTKFNGDSGKYRTVVAWCKNNDSAILCNDVPTCWTASTARRRQNRRRREPVNHRRFDFDDAKKKDLLRNEKFWTVRSFRENNVGMVWLRTILENYWVAVLNDFKILELSYFVK